MSSPSKIVAVVVLLFFGLAIGLWAISSQGISTEQRIADAQPPPPATVDVPIELRQLGDRLVFRGIVTAVNTLVVSPPTLDEGQVVVVDLPLEAGDSVEPGSVLAVVSHRPLILVSMPFPLHRRIDPSSSGSDIAILQRALSDLGHETGAEGLFDEPTQNAVRQLYEDRGFAVAETGEAESQALRAAEQAVRQARITYDDTRALGNSRATQRALVDLRSAEQARDEAASRVGVVIPLGEILGIPGLPGVVSSVNTSIGAISPETILTVTTADLVIHSTLDGAMASMLHIGAEAIADSINPIRLTVDSSAGQDDLGREIVRLVGIDPIPPELIGADLRIEAALVGTVDQVLAVPITAIRSNSECEFIRIVELDGSLTPTCVRVGMSLGGWVEIIGADQELSPGTLVRLG